MRKSAFLVSALSIIVSMACSKSRDGLTSVSLTPTTTTVAAGQTVALTLISNTNASKWTVTPSLNAKATYTITTSKVNYFTFTQPGVYTVAVSTKNVVYDAAANESLDSCWLHTAKSSGCVKGADSASAKITVIN